MNWKINLIVTFLSLTILNSCGIYSFTGASISADVKTISIPTFYNNAPLGPATMSITFTEKIRDYFLQNTNLVLVDNDGDLQIEGAIKDFKLTPVAVSASENDDNIDLASLTRLTIYVDATYVNLKDDTFDFDKTFSFFIDFDQNEQDLSANEEEFSDEIFDQIIVDIFNSSVANW